MALTRGRPSRAPAPSARRPSRPGRGWRPGPARAPRPPRPRTAPAPGRAGRARRARRSAPAPPRRPGPGRAARPSRATSRTARRRRGGRRGPERGMAGGERAQPVRGEHVRPASRSAAAAAASRSSAPAHSSQPSCDPAPGTGVPSASIAIGHSRPPGANAAVTRARSAAARASQPPAGSSRASARARPGGRLAVGVGERRRRVAARRAGGSRRRAGGRRPARCVAPALLGEPAGRAPRPVAHEPAAGVERPRQPRAGGPPGVRELRGERVVLERGEHDEEPARAVGAAVVAQLAVAHRPAGRGEPGLGDRPVLVQDLAGLLVGLRDRRRGPGAPRARAASPPPPRAPPAAPAAR